MASDKNIRQLSVFIENKTGKLSTVLKLIGHNKIDIRAMNIADTNDFGILRLILSDTESALSILKDNEYAVAITDVIAICVDDTPGGLAGALSVLDAEGISVEYMYASLSDKGDAANVVIRVDDNEKAAEALMAKNYRLITDADL
ncbi:MAG: acetolactate synthase [Ruminococcus sp.]|nr:acetolactate synthase [Ruminococcus sp.]